MAERPPVPFTPPAGHHWEPAPTAAWKLIDGADEPGRRCRSMGAARRVCGAPAVAALNRAAWRRAENWWAYCAEHMYGNWIEDGRVLCWVLHEDEGGAS